MRAPARERSACTCHAAGKFEHDRFGWMPDDVRLTVSWMIEGEDPDAGPTTRSSLSCAPSSQPLSSRQATWAAVKVVLLAAVNSMFVAVWLSQA